VQVRRAGGIAGKGHWEWSLAKESTSPLRSTSQKLAPLGSLGDSQGFEGDETPKGANNVNGSLSDDNAPEPSSFEPDEEDWIGHRFRPGDAA
jgi:hypothetical protein